MLGGYNGFEDALAHLDNHKGEPGAFGEIAPYFGDMPEELMLLKRYFVHGTLNPPQGPCTADPAPPQSTEEVIEPVQPTLVVNQAPTPSPVKTAPPVTLGYTGETCRRCGSFAMRRTGACSTCEACGESGGCA